MNISDASLDYAKEVMAKLEQYGIRVELDDRNESIGKKIREAQLAKTPYMLVLGEKEVADGTVAVRKRGGQGSTTVGLNEFIDSITKEIRERSL
jgi:threonyl-tRNA synthetase